MKTQGFKRFHNPCNKNKSNRKRVRELLKEFDEVDDLCLPEKKGIIDETNETKIRTCIDKE